MPKKVMALILSLSLLFTLVVFPGVAIANPEELFCETLVSNTKESVVVVYADDGKWQTMGTGFFYGKPGQVVTCYHVIDIGVGGNIDVKTQDGKLHDAMLIASNQYHDWAILQIENTDYPVLEGISRAYDVVEKDTPVFTVGHPLGKSNVVTTGLVKHKHMTDYIPQNPGYSYMTSIYAYLEVHNGNSGGPVLDYQGKVLGIVRRCTGLLWGTTYTTQIAPIDVIDNVLTLKPAQ